MTGSTGGNHDNWRPAQRVRYPHHKAGGGFVEQCWVDLRGCSTSGYISHHPRGIHHAQQPCSKLYLIHCSHTTPNRANEAPLGKPTTSY